MSDQPTGVSRRSFVTGGATLLAGFGVAAALPASRADADPTSAARGTTELALYRPTAVSSTDWAPTPGEFAVDGLAEVGVRGSGWRAGQGDPQWIAVDLQAPCRVHGLTLVFEATSSDPTFVPPGGPDNPRAGTTGFEILSSCAVEFSIETSLNGTSWQTAYRTTSGTGGVMDIPFAEPVKARWVRMTVTKRSNGNPLGLNGLQVFGVANGRRPAAEGWTSWSHLPRHDAGRLGLRLAADGTAPVESGWYLTMDDWAGTPDGAQLSRPRLDTREWLPASVPGTVLSSLVAQEKLPDPAYGLNDLHIPEALSRHSWWYHRTFMLPRRFDTGRRRRIWLEFDGINHHAEIWLNGVKVGELTHPFARAAFDVTDALGQAHGKHALAVKIDPQPYPGSPGDKSSDGRSYNDAGSDMMNRNTPTYLSITGWDWMPAVRDRASGIWNHVRLRSTGDVVVGDPRVDTKLPGLPDTSRAELTVTVPVRNAASSRRSVRVSIALLGVSTSTTVALDAGASSDVTFDPKTFSQLTIKNPQLWWPNGYGEATLHELTMTTAVGGRVSDSRTVRFGIRQFDYYSKPSDRPAGNHLPQTVDVGSQQARYLRILAHTRATIWGASIWTLSAFDSVAPNQDLARGKPATASSTDNPSNTAAMAVDGDDNTRWSSAYQDEQWIQVDLGVGTSFDQIGITWESAFALTFSVLVSDDGTTWRDVKDVSNASWQDAGSPLQISVNGVRVFCRGGNWGFDDLLRRMLPDRMNDTVGMHRDMNFTMIRNWLGQSDREEFFAACDENGILVWNDFWSAWFMDPPDHDGYLSMARDTIRRYRIHPCIAVWCAKNEGNPSTPIDDGLRTAIAEEDGRFYQPNSAGGIVSGGGPYWRIDAAQYFSASTYSGVFGFHTEIGMPTVPVADSMRSLAGGQPSWPIGDVWYNHDWCFKGAQGVDGYKDAIDRRLGASSTLDEFCRKAQLVNYEGMRAMFEAWNAHLWQDASGLLLWMSHPAHHSTVWQTYDYDLDVNGSYYGARKGCEPLHIQANAADWSVIAVNHTPDPVSQLTASAQLYELSGKPIGSAVTAALDLPASATAPAFSVPFDASLPACHLLRLQLRDRHGRVVADNTYWRYRNDTDLQALNDAGRTKLHVTRGRSGFRPGNGHGELSVTIRNSGPTVAAMVRASLRDRHSGERVLPAQSSDNYVWLLPGERRDLTITWPARGLRSTPTVSVEAYNAPTVTV